MTAKQVLYAGRVQGVGFRQTTAEIAEKFAIDGFVRNLPGGEVELLAQGDPAEVERFLTAIDRRMAGYIQSRTTNDAPVGAYDGFEIRLG